jgi:uncharacterized protein (TIGR02271 family)
MKNHDLIGFYQTREQAERAREELLAAGFDRDDTKVYSADGSETGGGFWDGLKEAFGIVDDADREVYAEAARRGAVAVAVSLDDDESPSAERAIQVLQRHNPIDLDASATQWRAEGWTPRATARTAQTTTARTGKEAIPIVEEKLNVGKRRVLGGGVRIHNRVIEKPAEARVELREEHVNVERRPVDRPATDADRAFQERTVEATETVERPVVSKEARVVEEVSLNKQAQQRTETVRDTVRRTDVEVEKIAPEHGRASSTDDIAYVDQFATEIASDQRYRGRDWDTLEPDVRRTFEQRYPGNRWEQVKDAVRRGYDRARSKI